jgi:hypothetical protein
VRLLRLSLLALLAAAPAAAQGVPPLGTAPLDAQTAAKFFSAVCLDTVPGFGNAGAALQANGFAPNPETGTYYHPRLDLSFHVEGGCSMVFGSDATPGEIGLAFAMATAAAAGSGEIGLDPVSGATTVPGPAGTLMRVEPFTAPSGQSYFRALLAPAP